jgi:hypothetical protein
MKKVRLLLIYQGRVEHDIETEMMRPRLKDGNHFTETICLL